MTVKSRFRQLSKPEGVASWVLDYSTRVGKKWMVKLELKPTAVGGHDGRRRTVHFGDSSMEDYTQHHDEARRKRFHQRFASLIVKTQDDYLSPMFYSTKLLW